MREAPNNSKPNDRILVVSLAGIGDTVQSTPFLAVLRSRFPDALIDVAVRWPGSAELLRGNPNVDRIHQFDLISGSKFGGLRFLLGLRRERYDLSFTLHPQGRREYRIVTRFVGARRRLSHQYENESVIDRFLVTDSLPQDYGISGPANNLRLLTLLGQPLPDAVPPLELHPSPEERRWADCWVESNGLDRSQWLGIHVGSGGTKNLALRRWPVDCWIDWAKRWNATVPTRPLVAFGGPGEVEAHQRMAAALPSGAIHFPETPGLRHAAALVGRASAFLSVDTAFMHIAAAMRVPRQWVIETPTLNRPVEPHRPDWIRIPNAAVGPRALDFYRYDGRPILGRPDEIEWMMRTVTPEEVLKALLLG